MNEKLSRRLLVAEAAVFALPLTGLLTLDVAVTVMVVRISPTRSFWPLGANALITALNVIAVSAVWLLIARALLGGAEALRTTNRGWWFAALLGPLLILPAPPEYSLSAIFRDHLGPRILGAPLLLILVHLWADAHDAGRYV